MFRFITSLLFLLFIAPSVLAETFVFTAFRLNQVQLAWLGGLTGIQARRLTPGAKAIVQGHEDARFKSYFIAHTSTNLAASDSLPKTLHGKTMIFGSKSSTSGRLMPAYYLHQQFQKSPEKIFHVLVTAAITHAQSPWCRVALIKSAQSIIKYGNKNWQRRRLTPLK